jgi:prepilin-type N-terminal cleavage/methylation domain-containing protein
MRKGLTLIELIFTIVIIALVFTVIPKIVLSLNKSDSFVIRQDAMFNGVSMMKMISNMPWDENNTESSDILHVSPGNVDLDCNETTDYRRIGGFIGSRTCEENKYASAINLTPQTGDDIWVLNDIGDFNDTNITASHYVLHVEVKYIDDNISYNYIDKNATITINKEASASGTTNLKYVDINVFYQGERGKEKHLTQFNYTSANIGQMIINKRVWR